MDFELSSFSIIFPVPGFLIKPINGQKGCEVGYVTHTNPRGKIPTWLTNKVTSYVAPRMLRKLHKACIQVNNLQQVPFVHNFIKPNWQIFLHSSGCLPNATFGSGKKIALAKIHISYIHICLMRILGYFISLLRFFGYFCPKNRTNDIKLPKIRVRQIYGIFWKIAVMKFA